MFTRWKLADFASGAGLAAGAHAPAFDDQNWLPTTVPGDVHTTLIAAGRIDDPFYDRNEAGCAWMETREWWYRTSFDGPDAAQPGERLRLIFHGLDTFVTIWLNGEELGRHQNMFRPAVFDVTAHLRAGAPNTLALCFDPPLDHVGDAELEHWGDKPEPRILMRKAQFGYGWDWGPRLPTIGIWRPVELRRERCAVLSGVQAFTLDLDMLHASAMLAVRVEAECFATTEPLSAHLRLFAPGAAAPIVEQTVSLIGPAPLRRTTSYLAIEQPQLWWTHDLGDPARYTLEVTLSLRGVPLDQQRHLIGIRTLTLDQSPDPEEPGTRFFRFVLNGVPIFAKGANWIPADSFVGAIPAERYALLLARARDANMTMLRVWGGGIYEHDQFYNLCDELGILVWQDFMFACAPYPETDTLLAEVEAEALYQVRRLRNHPCLALWCGNNENQWLHELRYWDEPGRKLPGAHLYHVTLPAVVAAHGAHTPYWPGSPYGGNDHNAMDDGDRHNWDVWHGSRPLRRRFGEQPGRDSSPDGVSYLHYARDYGRFISEFGMHAAPVLATLERVLPPEQRFHHSPALDHHNKDTPKNKGDNLMASVTGLPRDLREYIDFSMIAQAEGLKFAIEHYRRRTPHCSGALFWQLNDCWPVLSWSVLDYYGVGKAGYFYAKRAYAPVLASFKSCDDGSVELWITNDMLHEVRDTAVVAVRGFTGEERFRAEVAVAVPPTSSHVVGRWGPEQLRGAPDCYLNLRAIGGRFAANRHFFRPLNELIRPPARLEWTYTRVSPEHTEVTVRTDVYASFVHLTCADSATFSDNYVDMEAGETRTLGVQHPAALCGEQIGVHWR